MSEIKVGDTVRLSDWGRSYYTSDARRDITSATVTGIDPLTHPYRFRSRLSLRAIQVDLNGDDLWYLYEAALEVIVPVPTFTSIEEADAWLEAHTPTEGR